MMIELVDVRLDHPRGGEAPPLVSNANLGVARGEVVVIVGAAGVGTSRIVAAALGEVPCAGGRIEVFGRDVGKLRRSSLRLLRRRIGIIPQDLCLLEDRSAQLNVCLPLEIDGIPRSATVNRAAECLAAMNLDDESSLPVDCLSGSARQRVAVARAMIREPELILADHPTTAQDADGCERVCEAFYEAASRGSSVLVFSRDPALRSIAERNRWRQLLLIDGQLMELGALDPNVDLDSQLDEPALPNLVPFPLTATAGAR
jgi:ABC-type ATPase involved in cell division